MILSASRRTDIPAYYSDWFLHRLQEGFVCVRNPRNPHQISRISLSPDIVDCIVFWTKNPMPMMERLDELKSFHYYFQFTLTPYGNDVEPGVPSKRDVVLPAFRRLSEWIGAEKIIWRYDPILINEKYSVNYHIHAFQHIAEYLSGKTSRVTISFIDEHYRGVQINRKELALIPFPEETRIELSIQLAQIAQSYGMAIDICAESLDLQPYGIGQAHCIDGSLMSKIIGSPLYIEPDKTQRLACGCAASIDIGAYNTCRSGCRYCYANYSRSLAEENCSTHDPLSPLLSGEIADQDKITVRDVRSLKDRNRSRE